MQLRIAKRPATCGLLPAAGFIMLGFGGGLQAQLPAYNIPDDPAFVFLGVAPKRVANPGTLPALGIALADGIDLEGRVNAGVAISFLPSNVLRYNLTPERYRNGRPSFWLYNTQVSIGTVRKSGDTAVTDLALGIRTILLGPEPYSDPEFRNRMAVVLDHCLTQATGVDTSLVVVQKRTGVRAAPVRDSTNPTRILRANDGVAAGPTQDTARMWKVAPNTVDREIALECAGTGKSRAIRAWMKDHWNDVTLAISAATGTRFDKSAIRDRASLGQSLWLLGAVPIRWTKSNNGRAERVNLGQIAAQLHWMSASGGVTALPGETDESAWDGGIRALAGKSTVNAFIELTRNLKTSAPDENRSSWATGVEFMIAQSIWLSAGVGARYSERLDADRDFVFLNLKWGIAREARLGR